MLLITGLYASILALIILALAANVVKFRRSQKVGLGDNGDSKGIQTIRAHANTVEYIPILLILMAIYEANSGNSMILHGIGIATVIARILYAIGLNQSSGVSFGRFYGTLITWLIIIGLSVLNLLTFAGIL